MSILYIVATPIGNLEDITLRALRILKDVDVVFAEDTREAKKLLGQFEIQKPIERYDEHSHAHQVEKILQYLRNGKNVAYVSDAGTPGISDPGARLISYIRDWESGSAETSEISIVPIPGPSALATAVSVSGLKSDEFHFFGFLPHKKGRETMIQKIGDSEVTSVFYESSHRILKALDMLCKVLEEEREVVVARELTKVYEEIVKGSPTEVQNYFSENLEKVRGEFVVLVSGKGN